jgi:hypothetical protein
LDFLQRVRSHLAREDAMDATRPWPMTVFTNQQRRMWLRSIRAARYAKARQDLRRLTQRYGDTTVYLAAGDLLDLIWKGDVPFHEYLEGIAVREREVPVVWARLAMDEAERTVRPRPRVVPPVVPPVPSWVLDCYTPVFSAVPPAAHPAVPPAVPTFSGGGRQHDSSTATHARTVRPRMGVSVARPHLLPMTRELREILTEASAKAQAFCAAKAEAVCAVCLESLEEGTKTTACGHSFHGACLDTWLAHKPSCPVCRADVWA